MGFINNLKKIFHGIVQDIHKANFGQPQNNIPEEGKPHHKLHKFLKIIRLIIDIVDVDFGDP